MTHLWAVRPPQAFTSSSSVRSRILEWSFSSLTVKSSNFGTISFYLSSTNVRQKYRQKQFLNAYPDCRSYSTSSNRKSERNYYKRMCTHLNLPETNICQENDQVRHLCSAMKKTFHLTNLSSLLWIFCSNMTKESFLSIFSQNFVTWFQDFFKAIKIYLKKSLLRLLGEVPPHESARLHEVWVQLALHLLLHPPPRDEKIYLKITIKPLRTGHN